MCCQLYVLLHPWNALHASMDLHCLPSFLSVMKYDCRNFGHLLALCTLYPGSRRCHLQRIYLIVMPLAANSSDIEASSNETSLLGSFIGNITAPSASTTAQYSIAAQIAKACIIPDNAGYVTSTNWRFDPQAGYYTTPNGTQYLLRARKFSVLDRQQLSKASTEQ